MSNRNTIRLSVFLATVLLSVLVAVGFHVREAAANSEPKYLMFQIFTAGPGFTTKPGRHVLSELPSRQFLKGESRAILDAIGERGDADHKLGIMVGPLALDHSDEQIRTLIEWTFEIAVQHEIAVGLHIDDSKFWSRRSDLWKNADNVEWLDWDGTPNSGQLLNWGEPWKLAPQACFNSPALVKEVKRIGGQVIGPAIFQQISKLRAKGLEDLFAGVIVGWETAIGRDFDSGKSLGYCALANRGYTKSSPPRSRDKELEAVVKEWIELWSDSIATAGVPTDRIYSHIAFTSRNQYEAEHGGTTDDPTYSQSVMYSPPEVAFGVSHRPAFSIYAEPRILSDVYAALDANGNPPWGSAEGTNIDIHRGKPTIPAEGMENYLAHMFNHGATMTNLFGWGIGDKSNPFRRATEGDDAIAAYRKFLRGERLNEKPLSSTQKSDNQTALQKRMRSLPGRIEAYRNAGGDMSRIKPRVENLESHLKNGRYEEMERELDRLDDLLNSSAAAASTDNDSERFDVAELQAQMKKLPRKIETYHKNGGVMSVVEPRVKRIQQHIQAGDLNEAFEELQELIPILESQ